MNLLENFSLERFVSSLRYMWQGMICIFVVIGVIILATILMNTLCNKADEKRLQKDNENEQE
ncbi:MAG: hypothetical protein IKB34_06020 [Clostridia bacterium]|nr:hypothetical protein [Clostridia bacterium]